MRQVYFKKYPYFFLDRYVFCNPGDSMPLTPSNVTFKNGYWDIMINYVKEDLGMLVILDGYMDEMTKNKSVYKKIPIDEFLPMIYFAYAVKKDYKHKEAVSYLIQEIKKDSNLNYT